MALVKPDQASFARIKVIGVGGGGGNVVNAMINDYQIKGVEFVAINTDAQALHAHKATTKVQIGEKLTRGLGVGGDPEIGREAAEESREKIKEYFSDSDMIFLAAGLGGGTGTGALPILADLAKELGILTIAVVTKPFAFEGSRRMVAAEDGLEKLRERVDTLIVVPNQKIMEVVDQKMTLIEAFKIVDGVLAQGVQGISDIITVPGLINRDFADVKTIMQEAGSALLGIGSGQGENRAVMAAKSAIESPLIDVSISGARGILFNIVGSSDLTMSEVDEAARIIAKEVDADANIIFGATIDQNLKDQIKITVIATGFDRHRLDGIPTANASYFKPQGIVSDFTKPKPDSPTLPVKQVEEETSEEREEEKRKAKEKLKDYQDQLPEDFEVEDEFDIPAFLRQEK